MVAICGSGPQESARIAKVFEDFRFEWMNVVDPSIEKFGWRGGDDRYLLGRDGRIITMMDALHIDGRHTVSSMEKEIQKALAAR